MARFDLASIRLAILCAEAGSLSAAARAANCSLSNASRRLAALEEAIGTPLFTRSPQGLQVTLAGTRFVQHGEGILEHLEAMSSVGNAPALSSAIKARREARSAEDIRAEVTRVLNARGQSSLFVPLPVAAVRAPENLDSNWDMPREFRSQTAYQIEIGLALRSVKKRWDLEDECCDASAPVRSS